MRILIWCPHISFGGGLRLLQQLAPAIARHADVEFVRLAILGAARLGDADRGVGDLFRGLEVFELTEKREEKGGPPTVRSWLESEGRVLGIRGTGRLKAAASRLLPRPEAARAEVPWEYEQLERAADGCDVVYCFWPHHVACPTLDKPIACTYQDTTLIDFPEILGAAASKRLRDLSVSWMEKSTVVVSSEATRNNLVRLFGPGCETARVIHHAILPESDGARAERHTDLLEKLPRDYVIFPGHPSSSKNHDTLLTAWARFGRRKECPLVLLGPDTQLLSLPPHQEGLSFLYHVLKLQGQIARYQLREGEDFYVLGYVEDKDVLPLVGNAKALIMPTLAEGGGSYPVEEALAVGTPVLCSDIPVLREHLRGRTAKIGWFDPNSADSIHRSLDDLLDNYDAYKQSALRGVSDPRPTWDDVAAQYVDVFRSLVR